MEEQIQYIKNDVEGQILKCSLSNEIEELKIKIFGKNGILTGFLKGMKDLSNEERPLIGSLLNEVKDDLQMLFDKKLAELEQKELNLKLQAEKIDVTFPAKNLKLGHAHLLSIVCEDVKNFFISMGYEVIEGPEIEKTYYNFDALNTPIDHPARDLQDTFYITDNIILRTQTSPVQIRTMENKKPPIKVIAPGRVYRSDAVDPTHSPVFHQVEGLVVDKDITFANLKWTLEELAKHLFGENAKIRLRPHHFPFTEPSAEVDVSCFICNGKGCKLCKQEGWIEILGAGMVHSNVLKAGGVDPNEYSGFAFGIGMERIAMLKYEVDDMRLLYENDVRFLKQF